MQTLNKIVAPYNVLLGKLQYYLEIAAFLHPLMYNNITAFIYVVIYIEKKIDTVHQLQAH